MEKLELKHLAPYLPYELKIKSPHGFRPNGKESTGVSGIVYLTGDLYADIDNDTFLGAAFKPILRNLSDLIKEIEVNGEKFIPALRTQLHMFDKKLIHEGIILLVNRINTNTISYCDMQYLISLHFDVFGLIEKGLAVDINTLKL